MKIDKQSGPFTYKYISYTSIPGIKLPANSKDPLDVYAFSELNTRAFLTHDCEKFFFHYDQSAAIGTLLLTGLHGIRRFGKLSKYWNHMLQFMHGQDWTFSRNLEYECLKVSKNRIKKSPSVGCYLIYEAEGDLINQPELNNCRRIGDIGFGIDILEGDFCRNLYKRTLNGC